MAGLIRLFDAYLKEGEVPKDIQETCIVSLDKYINGINECVLTLGE